ncbi:MAG: arginine--tRNA ligase [Vicinamibacterales bacterium]
MILPVHDVIRARVRAVLTGPFGLAEADCPSVVLEVPPRRALGDLSTPVAFELARRLRKAPKVIAQDLATALGEIAGVARVEPAGNGYLNVFLDRAEFLRTRLAAIEAPAPAGTGDKVIVEHTAINPNKAAHIGHLRNSALGDTLVRALRFLGRHVEVQNYIDDTGVQVADVVVGFTELESRDLAAVQALAADPAVKFDYYCWDLYARVTEWYEADKARLEVRARALHDIEEGGTPAAEMGAFIADRIVRCHLRTMARINVDYDLLTWEGDILRLHFWATAFEELKRRKAVFLQTEGRLEGCWVMPIEEPGGGEAAEPGEDDAEQREKVIVRSNGTVTYVGKDIANQFWKFGLLGRDFHYRVFDARDGHPLWATTSSPEVAQSAPAFGQATAVYNVIDSRQAYLQQLLKQALAAMGFTEQAERSTHFSYEMVALTHATARALGYDTTESDGKPFVEVSGRKGLGVKADDLLDRLVDTAEREVAARNPDAAPADRRRTAEIIAVAAVRYFLVKFTRGKVIAFDIDEALSFEGETGPYLQYAVVRAQNILAKLADRDGVDEAALVAKVPGLDRAAIDTGEEGDELWNLVLEAGRLDEIVETAVRSLELSVLAKYAFALAQAFNAFYHRQQILREEREDARLWRAAAVAYVRRQLTRALDLMGCAVPARM